MKKPSRRQFLQKAASLAGAGAATMMLPPAISKALAIPARQVTGSISDVQHVVILMQENRSFDHYFGTMKGVRGFGDRFPIPLASGKSVWHQSDGQRDILPFHLNTNTTKGMRVPMTPHTWPDAQSAWDLGRFGYWPKFKEFQSMGYYQEGDIPFQFALAKAFTLCDANHCSIQTGTTPNRMVFMTGTNAAPGQTTPAQSQRMAMIDNSNNRGEKDGLYNWTSYPERLTKAGVSWQIYQNKTDPEENPPGSKEIGALDNWGGLCAPWESLKQYREAKPGSALYENAMRAWSLDELRKDVMTATLPQVSWIVPPPNWSEHPYASSPLQGAGYTQQVLEILTANPEVWSKTVFIITFDENDGLFDHMPPPSVPAFQADGKLAGAITLPPDSIAGHYFTNAIDGVTATRPYGLGPRVPLYVISPWSRGGWVNSQVFDHTSVIRFLEQRFRVTEPNISSWHRAVTGDLTSCFDFVHPNAQTLPALPDMHAASGKTLVLPPSLADVALPEQTHMPQQASGTRPSRALPYAFDVDVFDEHGTDSVAVCFHNTGRAGAVFHVYDRLHLDRVPRRYTVESGKELTGRWLTGDDQGRYDLWILGPNGFHRHFSGTQDAQRHVAEIALRYRPEQNRVTIRLSHHASDTHIAKVADNAYGSRQGRTHSRIVRQPDDRKIVEYDWDVSASGGWYDFTVTTASATSRYAGRMENGEDSISDPAMG